jgi:hypothetical protein
VTALQYATIDDLVAELAKRTTALVMCYKLPPSPEVPPERSTVVRIESDLDAAYGMASRISCVAMTEMRRGTPGETTTEEGDEG